MSLPRPHRAHPVHRGRAGADPRVHPRHVQRGLGHVDRPAHRGGARGDGAADRQAVQVDARDGERRPRAEEAAGEVQGRQAAPAAGDHEVLCGEQDQSVCLLSAAAGPVPVLHRPVLPAAGTAARAHLRRRPGRRRGCRRQAAGLRADPEPDRRRAVSLRPGPDRGRHGLGPRRPAVPLRRARSCSRRC